VKLGLMIDADSVERLVAQARAAETAGLDIAWLPQSPEGDTAVIRAAAAASGTSVIRLAACAQVGGHPLEIAETAAVADNCSNGRLILVLEEGRGDAGLLEETVEVVLAGLAPRPFRHDGERWKIPGNLPENDQQEEQIIVTPQAVQPELPVWLAGPAAAGVARTWALSHLSGEGEEPGAAQRAWSETKAALGPVAHRIRRPSLHFLQTDGAGEFDADALVRTLRAEQRSWGSDVAVVRLPAELSDDARAYVAHRIAVHVRPRVTLRELPAGIEQHWNEVLV
jgi:alkanesulfonate monooxygenase SsuD/methylene tetrahydromethanopterin reductase-like flavin-dependent oxidoreductase (luciferase family)